MPFTGNENHQIDLKKASEWTARFRATITPGDTIGEFFGKHHILSILNQEDCVGFRAYYSLDDNYEKHLIITGVTANEDDIFEGLLAENALKSPPMGGVSNPLNS